MTTRGAFPGRYPGILANRAKLFAIASHSFSTSSGGNSIWSFETEPGCLSTSTFIVKPRYAARFCRATAPWHAAALAKAAGCHSAGEAPALQLHNAIALHVNQMCLRHSKPVRQFPIIFAIEDRKVRELASFKR